MMAARTQALTDPYAAVGIAVRAAHETLRGRRPLSWEEMIDEVRAMDLVVVQEQWRAFHDSMLLGVPHGATWADQLPVLEFRTSRPMRGGRRYRSVNWPADRSRLTIDDGAVEISVGDEAQRIPLDRVAAVFAHEDG